MAERIADQREVSVIDLRQLAAAATHEVRNPLNTMAIHCELLESRIMRLRVPDGEREALLRSVAVLAGEVQRIDTALDRYLVHAGPAEADRQPLAADEWLAQVVAEAQKEARAKRVRIELRHPPLGRWGVDGEALGRALQAVLDNAVWASPPGERIEVTACSDGDRGQIRVADEGPGIAQDALGVVCQLGYSTREGHSGLGLAIARQVVKTQHGGELTIESIGGEGTLVTLVVPLDDEI